MKLEFEVYCNAFCRIKSDIYYVIPLKRMPFNVLLLRSTNDIKYTFDIVLFSKSSLNKTLSNIHLILVERSNETLNGIL